MSSFQITQIGVNSAHSTSISIAFAIRANGFASTEHTASPRAVTVRPSRIAEFVALPASIVWLA